MATNITPTKTDLVREIEASVLDASALDRLDEEIRGNLGLDPGDAADLLDRIERYRGQLPGEARRVTLEETMAERFPMSWRILNEGQRVQAAMAWRALPEQWTDDKRVRWMRETNAEAFTRLARLAMGEGEIVLGEAALAERLTWA